MTTRFELVDEGFADPCLTTWPRHHIWSEYFHSIWSGRRGSNSLPPPWQGGALPDELRPHIGAFTLAPQGKTTRIGLEPTTPSVTGWCSNQLSYRAISGVIITTPLWSGRRGSNSLPPPWQGGALPDELRPHIRCICPCTLPSDSCEFRGPCESLRSKILWGKGGISEFVTAVLLVRLPDKRLTFRRSDPDRARTDDPQRDRLVL